MCTYKQKSLIVQDKIWCVLEKDLIWKIRDTFMREVSSKLILGAEEAFSGYRVGREFQEKEDYACEPVYTYI